MARSSQEELVVLLDPLGRECGAAAKRTVHHAVTPLHLAFSCHVLNERGEMLVSRRALSKRTWPGVWSNAFCGHPAPGEAITDALQRRAADELGITVSDVTLMLPRFQYTAVDDSGVVENELCPVFTATTDSEPNPNPSEVMAVQWVSPHQLAASISHTPWAFSPWLVMQVEQLAVLADARELQVSA